MDESSTCLILGQKRRTNCRQEEAFWTVFLGFALGGYIVIWGFWRICFGNIFVCFLVRPRFTKTSGNTEAISGNAVRLFCRVSGFPRPTVLWKKDGHILKASRRQKLLANGDLEIMPVVQGDNGYYTCEARNTIGSTFHTMRIVVKGNRIVDEISLLLAIILYLI